MSFKENPHNNQTEENNKLQGLTEREKRVLENSWAKIFADNIFPAIDKQRFSVLYSTNKASRPNTPVNVIVGALIIKELFDYSDDEIVENLMFDLQLQYALHTTDFKEQPLSDKSLSRFRIRCYEYEKEHGINLFQDCVRDLSKDIAKIMRINNRICRMDSMMIASNIRVLGRMELIYTCISKLAIYISKNKARPLPETLKPYTDANDYNRVFYHQHYDNVEEKFQKLLDDSETLLTVCDKSLKNVAEYQNFIRCLSEQTVVENGKRRLWRKDEKKIDSSSLQNPSDPDATYRNKGGKICRGYAANFEEAVGKYGSVITDYQYEQSIYSDSQFLKDSIVRKEHQEVSAVLITDGGFGGGDNTILAEKKNINLITTGLIGKEAPDVLADFVFNDDGTRLLTCAGGHRPEACYYYPTTKQCRVCFDDEFCRNCTYFNQCNPKCKNGVARFITSLNASNRAKSQRFMQTDLFSCYARIRNGVETVPSNLRRNYHIEKLPRGKLRGRFFFGCKIAALNFRKLFNFMKGWGNYALNSILT